MRRLSFEHIIIKSPKTGAMLSVTTLVQAADILAKHWTTEPGSQDASATRLCMEALKGKASTARARKAFLDTAKEIGTYAEEKTLKP
ncbi:DUF982 domain-containing protein [Phyllobacterium myrsinacearum]|uniref:DUF982 domain-containing protein n=1 Tax=Phyllobacterium myrsinacearum TaxID=28101 RepID=UPI0015F90008|nr:DUF982 domain-containing protein [Phyllobacterium myrsinacearum]